MSEQLKKALISVSLCISGFILCQTISVKAETENNQPYMIEETNQKAETTGQETTTKKENKTSKTNEKDEKAILAAPETLEVTKSTYQSVTLSWGEVEKAASYQIEVATDGTNYTVIKKTNAQTRTCKCGKLTTGMDYTFRVCAVDENGRAGNYSLVTVKPALKKAAFVSAQPLQTGAISLEWKKVTGADSYQLYRKKTGEDAYKLVTTTAELSYLDKDTFSDGTYSYYVQAVRIVNGKGVSGKASKKVNVEWRQEPVKLLSVEAVDYRSSSLTWQSLEYATGYYVYRSKKEDGAYQRIKTITNHTTTSYVDKGIVPGKRFYYKVCAYWQRDNQPVVLGEQSAPMSVKTELAPPELTSAQANTNHRSLSVIWEQQKEATGYRLYRSVYPNKKFKKIAELGSGKKNNYEDRSVQPGGTYYYQIKSIYKNKKYTGISTVSTVQSGSVLPSAPNGLKIEQTATDQFEISWNRTNGAQSYKLYRRIGDTGVFTCIASELDNSSYTDEGIKDGQTYFYRVSALGVVGEGTKCTPVNYVAGGISLNTRTLKLCVGASKPLKKKTLRQGRIIWKSDNPSVASVDSSGVVTGISYGTATVTATVSGKSAQATVSVVPGVKNGIDVSVWQPEIDWTRVQESGIDFAFLRISYHYSEDTTFETKYADASSVGMPLGVYCYSKAATVEEAQEEARRVLEILNGRKLDYPVVLDIEDSVHKQAGMTKDKLHTLIDAFQQKIEDAGYQFALYSYLSFFQSNLDQTRLTGIDLWVARYGNVANGTGYSGTGNVRYWQYNSGQYAGSDFHVDGITDDSGNLVPVDVNVEYGVEE